MVDIFLFFRALLLLNIARIANAVQCHSLLSGHYDCNVLMFAIVRNVYNFATSLGLSFEGVLLLFLCWSGHVFSSL